MSKKKKDNKSDTDKADTKKGSGKRGNQSESVSKPVNKSVKARKRVVIKHRRRVKSKVDKELLKGTIGGAKKERSRKAKGKVVKKKKLLSPKALLASKKKKRKKTRKKSKKLKRSGESNRYQSIVKRLKKYYVDNGIAYTRADLYKKYREIRDEFSYIPISDLITDFEKIVIQRKMTRTFPSILQLPINWYDFEDTMTWPAPQAYFRSNDTIILDLDCLGMPEMKFPYPNVIGNYRRLYSNPQFRNAVKSTKGNRIYPVFEYDSKRSNIKKGEYVFVLEGCYPVSSTTTQPTAPAPTGTTTTPQQPVQQVDIKGELTQQITAIRQQSLIIAEAFRDKQMTYIQYRSEMDNFEEIIDELENRIKKL